MVEPFRRTEDRTDVDWIAVIRLSDDSEIYCSVKDVSAVGMKVSIPEQQALPETFMLRIIGKDLVFRVKQAWRRQHSVGVLIERIGKLADAHGGTPVDEPQPAIKPEHHRIGSRERFRSQL